MHTLGRNSYYFLSKERRRREKGESSRTVNGTRRLSPSSLRAFSLPFQELKFPKTSSKAGLEGLHKRSDVLGKICRFEGERDESETDEEANPLRFCSSGLRKRVDFDPVDSTSGSEERGRLVGSGRKSFTSSSTADDDGKGSERTLKLERSKIDLDEIEDESNRLSRVHSTLYSCPLLVKGGSERTGALGLSRTRPPFSSLELNSLRLILPPFKHPPPPHPPPATILPFLMSHQAPHPQVLYSFPTNDKLVKSVADFVLKAQNDAIKKRGAFCLAISGGSLPSNLRGLIGKKGVQWDKW